MSDRIVGKLKAISGKYMKEGVEKNRWVDVGKLMQRDDGSQYVLILKHVNPAGFPSPAGSDSITAVLFKEDDSQKLQRNTGKRQSTFDDDDKEPF